MKITEILNEAQAVVVNGKQVDVSSIEIDGIDRSDYPDFVDAYASYGEFVDGTEMSDEELSEFTDSYSELVHELVMRVLF